MSRSLVHPDPGRPRRCSRLAAKGFTAKTGIKVEVRKGSDFELANQIVAEGAASPADMFHHQNSPAMSLVSSKDLFAPVEAATKAQVPAQCASGKGAFGVLTAVAGVRSAGVGSAVGGGGPATQQRGELPEGMAVMVVA